MIESLGRAELDQSKSARILFIKLMRCPPPSFDVFCSTIGEFQGGDKLYGLLTSSVNSPVTERRSACSSGSKSAVSTSQQFSRQRRAISASNILRLKKPKLRQVSLTSPMQPSGSSVSVVNQQPSLSSDGGAERIVGASLKKIIVHVDETLKEEFEPYRSSVKGLLQSINDVPEKEMEKIAVCFLFIKDMPFSMPSRQKKVEEGEPDVAIAVKCVLRVFLPKTNVECFLAQKERLLGALPSLLGYENIEILNGSCSVFFTLKGIDFVRFFSDLHDPRALISFIRLDPYAEVQFGNLRPLKIARLLRQSSLLLPVSKALSALVQCGKEKAEKYSETFSQRRLLSAFYSVDVVDQSMKSELLRTEAIQEILEGEIAARISYNQVRAAFCI